MGISDRLRNFAKNWAGHEADRLLAVEAADEIDKLRLRLTFMEDRFGAIDWDAALSNGERV